MVISYVISTSLHKIATRKAIHQVNQNCIKHFIFQCNLPVRTSKALCHQNLNGTFRDFSLSIWTTKMETDGDYSPDVLTLKISSITGLILAADVVVKRSIGKKNCWFFINYSFKQILWSAAVGFCVYGSPYQLMLNKKYALHISKSFTAKRCVRWRPSVKPLLGVWHVWRAEILIQSLHITF